MNNLKVLGVDPAFSHMGLARVSLNTDATRSLGVRIDVEHLHLISTAPSPDKKSVRKSSDTLHRATILHSAFQEHAAGCALVFAEVPHGGALSATAARGLGIAVGILASSPVRIIEVSPTEVKRLFSTRQKAVPKSVIMEWAYKQWPAAPWVMHNNKRTLANEHLADALATIVAGIKTPEFKQLMSLHHAISSTHNDGPAPGRAPRRRISVGLV